LVLLRVEVQRLPLDDDRLLDRLPRRAEDAAEDGRDAIALDELLSPGRGDVVVGGAVLEHELDLPPEQPAPGIDVAADHAGDVGVGEPDERERPGLVGDDADLDRISAGCREWFGHALLPSVWRRRWGNASSETMLSEQRIPYIGSTPYLGKPASSRRVR